ncbi:MULTISPECIES: hypothetical protein [unclassified Sphingobium]|uniref:hypothetical protein n=1 Tax=unclassified Sphingobium TaxID=2611147 RepID=UPI000D160346|nr:MULTISPECIES: hypothetical protein [unclassified Sphingobium]MBG6118548.1 hypothetical protein [Sphingobium sp. JAI105]PSO10128.1 hypothetical protein C7E20_18840 [Sphingobium sp. AEW4]TWC98767.1 hypothetical protein FB595_12617 [Sphingobium sp. AEW010]TWD18357.1 hypothetical protein FB596_12717 [Sphingobium sp. AEW013]TWD20999.1 hypothetical protein FB594_12721 [Sphingobium sp. AEW001]
MVDHLKIFQELKKLKVDDFDLACHLSDEVNATLRALENGVSAELVGNVIGDVPGRTNSSVALEGGAYLKKIISFAQCGWNEPPATYREVDPLIIALFDTDHGERITIPGGRERVDIADAARALGKDIAILCDKHRVSLEALAACEIKEKKGGRPHHADDADWAIAQTVCWVMDGRHQGAIQFHTHRFAGKVPGKRTPPEMMEPRSILAKAAVAVFGAMESKLDVVSIKNLLTKYRKSLNGEPSTRFDVRRLDAEEFPEVQTKTTYNVVTALKRGGAVFRRYTKQ